jgi:hypothetical protein
MEVSSRSASRPDRLIPGERAPVPIRYEAEWGPGPVWTRWKREENSWPWRESNHGRPARRRTKKTAQHSVHFSRDQTMHVFCVQPFYVWIYRVFTKAVNTFYICSFWKCLLLLWKPVYTNKTKRKSGKLSQYSDQDTGWTPGFDFRKR